MQPYVVLMHGPSFGSSAAERNGGTAAEGAGSAAAGEVTGAACRSGAAARQRSLCPRRRHLPDGVAAFSTAPTAVCIALFSALS
jgi:hypothetical protein